MVSIVPVCCISWLNKVLNSVRKAESCAPRSTAWEPWATTWEFEAERGLGVAQRVEFGAGEENGERLQCRLVERVCEEYEAAGERGRRPELSEDGGRHHILCNLLGEPRRKGRTSPR
jgi:hypothetical protein